MVYLPTKLGHLWGFYVGKYTSTMDDLGLDIHLKSMEIFGDLWKIDRKSMQVYGMRLNHWFLNVLGCTEVVTCSKTQRVPEMRKTLEIYIPVSFSTYKTLRTSRPSHPVLYEWLQHITTMFAYNYHVIMQYYAYAAMASLRKQRVLHGASGHRRNGREQKRLRTGTRGPGQRMISKKTWTSSGLWWLEHKCCFSILLIWLGNFITTNKLIFFRGVRFTTNQSRKCYESKRCQQPNTVRLAAWMV